MFLFQPTKWLVGRLRYLERFFDGKEHSASVTISDEMSNTVTIERNKAMFRIYFFHSTGYSVDK